MQEILSLAFDKSADVLFYQQNFSIFDYDLYLLIQSIKSV